MKELTINNQVLNDVLVFSIQGDLDAFTVQKVRKTLDQLLDDGHRWIVVNCSELSYINSTAIGVLVGRMHHLRRLEGELALAELNKRVGRTITLVGGRRLFSIFDSVAEAVAKLSQSSAEAQAAQRLPDVPSLVLN